MTTEECSFLSMCGIRRETFFTLPSNLVTLNARVHALPLEVTRGSRARLSCSVPIKLLPHRKTSHSFKVLISFSYKNYFNQSNATGVFPINIFFHLQLTTYMQTCQVKQVGMRLSQVRCKSNRINSTNTKINVSNPFLQHVLCPPAKSNRNRQEGEFAKISFCLFSSAPRRHVFILGRMYVMYDQAKNYVGMAPRKGRKKVYFISVNQKDNFYQGFHIYFVVDQTLLPVKKMKNISLL